ncbi:AzlD domain-containing protein [Oscillospiraceae bacterium PP1C4]
MTLTASQSMMIIAVVAAVTICCRALPFVLFRDSRSVSGSVIYLGRILPFAIISILVVYCLRGIDFTAVPFGLPEIIATLLVVVIHVWKRNNLLSIGISTAVYMFLVQCVFPLS